MQNPPISPRGISKVEIKEPSVIDAKGIFQNVTHEVSREPRASKASATIEQLKDNRSILEMMFGYWGQEDTAQSLSDNFVTVRDKFFKEYEGVGVKLPSEIKEKFQVGEELAGNPAFLNEREANELKNLAYLAEEKMQFDKELREKPVVEIKGNLKDVFGGREPSEKELLKYADGLKKLLAREQCVPEFVLSDRDPRKFVFLFKGEGENKALELVVIKVKTLEDLDKLESNLKKCGLVAREQREQERVTKIAIINGPDPFGVKEAYAKKIVLEGFNKLNEDGRTGWDKFVGFFGGETAHVKQLKVNNQLAFTQLKIDFNRAVKGQNLNDVVSRLPEEVRSKLNSGERLTEGEVKQLQANASRAMREQRFVEDLRARVPGEIKGNLKAEFEGRTPEKPVFERYLSKLKEGLIRGGYPGLVASDVDPRKFLFFRGEQLITVIVNSVKDLDTLEAELNACRNRALEYAPKVEGAEDLKKEIAALKRENQKVVDLQDEQLVSANNKVKEQEARIRELMAQLDQQNERLTGAVAVTRENVEMQKTIDRGRQEYQELEQAFARQTEVLDENKNETVKVGHELRELKEIVGNVEHQKEVLQEVRKELQEKEEAIAIDTKKSEEMAVLVANQAKELQELGEREDELSQKVKDEALSFLWAGWMIGAGHEEREEVGDEVEQLRIEREALQKEIREMKAERERLMEVREDRGVRGGRVGRK